MWRLRAIVSHDAEYSSVESAERFVFHFLSSEFCTLIFAESDFVNIHSITTVTRQPVNCRFMAVLAESVRASNNFSRRFGEKHIRHPNAKKIGLLIHSRMIQWLSAECFLFSRQTCFSFSWMKMLQCLTSELDLARRDRSSAVNLYDELSTIMTSSLFDLPNIIN